MSGGAVVGGVGRPRAAAAGLLPARSSRPSSGVCRERYSTWSGKGPTFVARIVPATSTRCRPAPPGLASHACMALDFHRTWGGSSAGRAPRSHRGGQGFDPPPLHHQVVERSFKKAEIPSHARVPAFLLSTGVPTRRIAFRGTSEKYQTDSSDDLSSHSLRPAASRSSGAFVTCKEVKH